MKKIILLLTFICSILPLLAEKPDGSKMSAEDFLNIVRHPPGRECWASMEGLVTHRRSGKDNQEFPLYLGILFTPERTLAQIQINEKETYNVGQTYSTDENSTSISRSDSGDKSKSILADIGLRPEDLTMTFIFWKMIKEIPGATIKGRDCRVFLLQSPDKQETVRIHISVEYFFPLKVEWLKDNQDSPYRTLELVSFKKENDFWLVSTISLYGPGWKTRVEFDKTDAAYNKDRLPAKIFRQ